MSQAELYGQFKNSPKKWFSMKELHENNTDAATPALTRKLLALERSGMIKRKGEFRGIHYKYLTAKQQLARKELLLAKRMNKEQ